MGFKERIQEKIEKNTVKIPDLTWTDNQGTPHTETILLKKSKLPLVGDWSRIYPPINEDGSVNISNLIFGGKKNFFKLVLIIILLGFLFYQMSILLGDAKEFMTDKYIIIEKTSFNKFCDMVIYEHTSLQDLNGTIILRDTDESS